MQDALTTPEVATRFGVTNTDIGNLLRYGLVSKPPLFGGRYVWGPAAVEEARRALIRAGLMPVAVGADEDSDKGD